MHGYAYIQWKIALARMQDANMPEMTQRGRRTPPATRQIAEYQLNRYFEKVEARLPHSQPASVAGGSGSTEMIVSVRA